jgi:precorrin-2 dehydrogenase/sirohydrochlorin ferrochelatase
LVTVVSPTVNTDLAAKVDSGEICWVQSTYNPTQLSGAFLVVAATDDEQLNASIVTSASECGALVCDASSADRSQVIFGALHRGHEGLTVAVFTDGRDPVEARRTRDRIAGHLRQDDELEDRPGSA